jgi:Glyoxalase/Bleomycin resistance protein/Dioxygenase superfamily
MSEDQISKAIAGLHHVTAIASDPQRNLDFYTQVLGLRLVKRTIKFDDPHLRRRLPELRNSCVTLTIPTAQKIGHSITSKRDGLYDASRLLWIADIPSLTWSNVDEIYRFGSIDY